MNNYLQVACRELLGAPIILETIERRVSVQRFGIVIAKNEHSGYTGIELVVHLDRPLTFSESVAVRVLFAKYIDETKSEIYFFLPSERETHGDTSYVKKVTEANKVRWIYTCGENNVFDSYKEWGKYSLMNAIIAREGFPDLAEMPDENRRDKSKILGALSDKRYEQPFFQKQISVRNSFELSFDYNR